MQGTNPERLREVSAVLGLIGPQLGTEPGLLDQYLGTLAPGEFADAVSPPS